MENMFMDVIWLNVQAKYLIQTIYITLSEIWLYKSDPNAPSTCSEPGGKQWQHSIQGWRNYIISFDSNFSQEWGLLLSL